MRRQLAAALEESLTAAPDAGTVLRMIHTGIERRRRRNRRYRTGFMVTAIALVLIVGVAAASVSHPDRPPAGIPAGQWLNTIAPTWLPDGMVAQEFTSTVVGESISYHSNQSELTIAIDNVDRTRTLDMFNWQRTEINGRPAREWSAPNHTQIVFELPSGRWAELMLRRPRPDIPDAQPVVRDEATRIARSLRENGNLLLRTGFTTNYLPTGYRVIGLETNIFTPAGFGTIVCASGTLALADSTGFDSIGNAVIHHRGLDVGPGVSISMTNVVMSKGAAERIADIQGRAAYRAISGATVYVPDFHGGTLTINATFGGGLILPSEPSPMPGLLPLAELIKIAEGVRWAG